MRAVAAHSFAGGFDLGVRQAGFAIAAKLEGPAGFGVENIEANRSLLGSFPLTTAEPARWPRVSADLVYGNPRCSAFSQMSARTVQADGSRRDTRGVANPANVDMYEFVDYAAAVRPAVAIFESVDAASSLGLSLLLELSDRLRERSGTRYDVSLVLQDNASVGGVAVRRRVFWVASRVPFGVELPRATRVPTLLETLAPYLELPLSWEGTPDAHATVNSSDARRVEHIAQAATAAGQPWQPNERIGHVVERLQAAGVALDQAIVGNAASWRTHYAAMRWPGDKPARVMVTHGIGRTVHPVLDRCLTVREAAVIQGFPDEWSFVRVREDENVFHRWIVKGVPVQAARWIATWAMRAIAGEPGAMRGYAVTDRVRVIDLRGRWSSGADGQMALPLAAQKGVAA